MREMKIEEHCELQSSCAGANIETRANSDGLLIRNKSDRDQFEGGGSEGESISKWRKSSEPDSRSDDDYRQYHRNKSHAEQNKSCIL